MSSSMNTKSIEQAYHLARERYAALGAAWDYYCLKQDVPVGETWVAEVKRYEKDVSNRR
jgi:L-rhamnose isomerase